MSASSTCSARRAAANRANAQRSTGPRTPAGKHASSQNASTHHAYAADLLLPGESETLFHAHRDAFLQRLCPMDALELALAERAISVTWRLRRLQAADQFLTLMEEADLRESVKDQNQELEEFRRENDDFDDDDPSLPPLPNPVELSPDSFSPGFLIARALRAPTDDPKHHRTRTNCPFERLLATEQRLQGMMHRALSELRRLQSDRRNHPPTQTCPFLTPEEPDEESAEEPDHPTSEEPSPSVSSVSSVAEPPSAAEPRSLQNEPTCHNGSPARRALS